MMQSGLHWLGIGSRNAKMNITTNWVLIIVTVDPGSKPDKKLCSAERLANLREKEFRLCTVHWYIVNV